MSQQGTHLDFILTAVVCKFFKWCYSEVSKYLGMPLSIFNGICDYTVKCLSELPI